MSQVIIVSNRLPISVKKENGKLSFSSSIGGLATGLSSYVNRKNGNLWIGWPGIESDDLTKSDREDITKELAKHGYVPVFLSKDEIDNFYNGYSNSIIWPYFHGLPVKKFSKSQQSHWWKVYKEVNDHFLSVVLANSELNSQIWVHDYHFLLLPKSIRGALKQVSVGFFLHIPFPERKQLRRIPQSSMIVDGLLGADLIGFHTPSYVTNFLGCASDLNVKTIDPHQISYHNRQIRVAEFPMGIDYAKFTEASKTKDVRQLVHGYKKKYKGLKVIASVDRLDPSKGLVERLNAYRDYLRTYPKKQGKVIFVMVAAPSRTSIDEYQKLSQKLDKLASEINKEFGNEAWQPLEYINQPIPFEKVTALFKVADLAFIMPIKDGMNLAAKEFVASNHKGVLILSETAGAAEELKDALLVNPRNTEQIIKALNKGLNMRRNELQRRINRMRRQLSNNTVHDWAKTFVDTLAQPLPGTPRVTRSLSPRIEAKLVGEYKRASNRLLLLDYDGTLSKLTKDYSLKPSDSIIKLLKDLSKDKRNELVLISGRQKSQLDDWFEGINISLVAEHGATIKKVGGRWKTIDKLNTGWQQKLNTVLNEYVEDTPGSSIEVKPHSLVWHYRAASVYSANKNLVLIKRSLSSQLKKYGLSLMQGNKIIEIKNKDINKGVAAQSWLSGSHDFILTMGDDTTDEDLFNVVPFESATVKVGRGLTKAQYRLPTNKEVVQFLEKLI